MNKLETAFANGKALIPFITCGDPTLAATAQCMRAAAENGADMVILGIPFSAPTAEGPALQGASLRALQGGMMTDKALAFAGEISAQVCVPLAFMTYANVIFSYGADRFMAACAQSGVAGVIVPDLPFEEKEEFLPHCRAHGVQLISMLAPAPEARIAQIAQAAEGFVYIVSTVGAATAGGDVVTELSQVVEIVRKHTKLPCAIDFDITSPARAQRMAAISDGVMVASALVELTDAYGEEAPAHIGDYVRAMKAAL